MRIFHTYARVHGRTRWHALAVAGIYMSGPPDPLSATGTCWDFLLANIELDAEYFTRVHGDTRWHVLAVAGIIIRCQPLALAATFCWRTLNWMWNSLYVFTTSLACAGSRWHHTFRCQLLHVTRDP